MMKNFIDKYFSYEGVSTLKPWEFILANAVTVGFYIPYWAWAAWETVRLHDDKKYIVKSSIRAVLIPLTSFWLFDKLSRITKTSYSPLLLTSIAYIAYVVYSYNIDITSHHTALIYIGFALYSTVEAIILLPALTVHHQAFKKSKQPKGNNTPLLMILGILFLFSVLTYIFW